MRKALTVGVRRTAKYVLVKVEGEVDIATAPQLRERLWAMAADGRPLVADLDRVTFIDAAGLGALAAAASRAAAHGSSLHVVCTRRQTWRLFHLTGLDQRIPLTATLAEALRDLEAARGQQPGHGRQRHDRSDVRRRPGLRRVVQSRPWLRPGTRIAGPGEPPAQPGRDLEVPLPPGPE